MAVADLQMVGLIVFTETEDRGLVAVLQRRGTYDFENWHPESYPGGYQLTVWGGVKKNEIPIMAFWREILEELGWTAFIKLTLKETFPIQTDSPIEYNGKMVETFVQAVKVEKDFIEKSIRLGPSSGGICLVNEAEAELLKNLRDYSRDNGVINRTDIAIFPDSKPTLLRAFQWAKTQIPQS